MKFKQIPYLEFKKVDIDDYDRFIKNRKYIQVCKQYPNSYTTVHIVIYRENYENNAYFLSFSLYKELQRYKTKYSPYCEYYEVDSKTDKIQNSKTPLRICALVFSIFIIPFDFDD